MENGDKGIMKIIMFTLGNLPVPAILNGAIEILMTEIINENEKKDFLDITILQKYNNLILDEVKNYKCTKFRFFKKSIISNLIDCFNRIIAKIFKIKFRSQFIKWVVKEINIINCDYVIVWGGGQDVPYLYEKTNANIIMYFHTDPFFYLSKKMILDIISSSKKVICVSNYLKNKLINNINCLKPIEVLKIVTNYVRPEEVKLNSYRDLFCKQNNINDEKLIVYAGRLSPEKGVLELVESLDYIKSDIILIIAGRIDKNDYVKKIRKCAGKSTKKIIFLGSICHDELINILCISSLLIIPSQCEEAAGLISLESRVAKIPVIASNVGGLPEYCSKNNSSFLELGKNYSIRLANLIDKEIETVWKIDETTLETTVDYYDNLLNLVLKKGDEYI